MLWPFVTSAESMPKKAADEVFCGGNRGTRRKEESSVLEISREIEREIDTEGEIDRVYRLRQGNKSQFLWPLTRFSSSEAIADDSSQLCCQCQCSRLVLSIFSFKYRCPFRPGVERMTWAANSTVEELHCG